jgi:glutamine synthetase adenylyltransferase
MNHLHAGDLPDNEQPPRIFAAQKALVGGICFVEFIAFFIQVFALHHFPRLLKCITYRHALATAMTSQKTGFPPAHETAK